VPLNSHRLESFHQQVIRLWKRALSRRSQKARVTWERMARIARRWLPPVRIVHPYPDQRLCLLT
jgi:RNA-directed DNA polymerase